MNYSKGGYYEDELKYQKDQLAIEYLPAVKSMASRLKERLPSFIDYSDLVSTGTEELVKLSRRYDETQNDSFWGFAKKRVYGSMLDHLRSLDIISRNSRRLIKAMEIEVERYISQYGEEPSDQQLAKNLNSTVKKIKEARMASEIYTLIPLSDGRQFADQEFDISVQIEDENLLESITDELKKLPEREQLIMQLYYFEELSLKEVSDILGVTESRISQLHKTIIKKIREGIRVG
jgi:RNA polymerase sigma factor for flagellar operon FliA